MIVPPSGSGGVQFGFVQSPAIDFLARAEDPKEASELYGNAGLGEGRFHYQTLFENLRSMNGRATNDEALSQGGIVGNIFTHQLAVNGDPAFASDGHAVQSESNAWLDGSQVFRVVESTFGSTFEPNQVIGGSFENKGAVGLTNSKFGGDLATPGSQRAVTDLDVLDLDKFPLLPLQPLPERITQRLDLVHVPVLVPTSELGQSEGPTESVCASG